MRFACCTVFLGLIACGSSGGSGSDANTGSAPECTAPGTEDCENGRVCEPVTQTCEVPQGECADQTECTGGLYCETAAGVCLPSSVGTPCGGPENCDGNCLAGICGCDGVVNERQLGSGSLDVYLMLDRTKSMLDGPIAEDTDDCVYVPASDPSQDTKACYATYALADYAINQVSEADDVRMAFDVMSLHDDCTGAQHDDPEVDMTRLPVDISHDLVQRISAEDFDGGFGTQIEGALRGIVSYTSDAANLTDGREMIGVFITDGEPNRCDQNVDNLDDILAAHLEETGVRTFIIGMTGADEAFLEQLAIAGGAEPHSDYCGDVTPPCHYFNVGDGEGSVLAEALQAIQQQAVEIPCDIDITGLQAPEGEALDYSKVNVSFDDGTSTQTIGQVDGATSCPGDAAAWYYDNPGSPTQIVLCPNACDEVQAAGDGANLAVVAGCNTTTVFVD